MSEYTPQSYEPSIHDDGLRLLDAEFKQLTERLLGDQYTKKGKDEVPSDASSADESERHAVYAGIDLALQNYLYSELGLDSEQATGVVGHMHQQGRLPSVEECDTWPIWGVQVARLAVLTEIGSLYMNTSTPQRFSTWVPEAMKVALPEQSRHDRQCVSEDMPCRSKKCPARSIVTMVEAAALTPDYMQYSYNVDEEYARANFRSLLAATYGRGLIDQTTWRRLDDSYALHYLMTFGG